MSSPLAFISQQALPEVVGSEIFCALPNTDKIRQDQ